MNRAFTLVEPSPPSVGAVPAQAGIQRQGFSLVELSIVLVILGLLTGGILAGQSLIRASELRSITTQLAQYNTAVQAFSEKYDGLPGDLDNAEDFWGEQHATPATCRTTASSGTLTCNGNGDGLVIDNPESNESYRFWQHLVNAGLIEGSYNGITQGSTAFSSTSANSPAGKISNTLWFAWNWNLGYATGNGSLFSIEYGNYLLLGAPVANTLPSGSVLTPAETWNIDTKIDDGKPASGEVVNFYTTACVTASSKTDFNATYSLDDNTKSCHVMFREQF